MSTSTGLQPPKSTAVPGAPITAMAPATTHHGDVAFVVPRQHQSWADTLPKIVSPAVTSSAGPSTSTSASTSASVSTSSRSSSSSSPSSRRDHTRSSRQQTASRQTNDAAPGASRSSPPSPLIRSDEMTQANTGNTPTTTTTTGASRRGSWSPRRARKEQTDLAGISASPPDKLVGLSSQWQLRQLEKLAHQRVQQDQFSHLANTSHTPLSAVAAGKRSAVASADEDEDLAEAERSEARAQKSAMQRTSMSTPRPSDANAVAGPSLYKTSRGRSAHVSPSRRWDRRGASANVVSGNSASGSGEESEITIAPRAKKSVDSALPSTSHQHVNVKLVESANRPPMARRKSSNNSASGRRSVARQRSQVRAGSVTPEIIDEGDLTSSDEEGADASRYARSRRASLERDRRRGMQILLTASGGWAAKVGPKDAAGRKAPLSPEESEQFASYEGFTSASTSASATPTTHGGDDYSERSSLLSRSSSTDAFDPPVTSISAYLSPPLAMSSAAPSPRERQFSNTSNSAEPAEAAFFGLADDEDEPVSAMVSAQALSAALTKRSSRSRVKSANDKLSPDKIRSMPGSRRPSHPESSCLAPAASTSVPHRPGNILGFAPVSSSSPQRFATVPKRTRQQALQILSTLAQKRKDEGEDVDLLSGSSIGSVEDLITIDKVEWANDSEGHTPRRRPSVVSIRTDDTDQIGGVGGDATIAAVEAKSWVLPSGGTESESDKTNAASVLPYLTRLPPSPTGASLPTISSSSTLSGSGGDDSDPDTGSRRTKVATYQERLSNLQSQLRLWTNEARGGGSESNGKATEASGGSSPPSGTSTNLNTNGAGERATTEQSGLLASSWRQIARLPNLLLFKNRAGSDAETGAGATAGGHSSSDVAHHRSQLDGSAAAAAAAGIGGSAETSRASTPFSSPDSSGILEARSSSDPADSGVSRGGSGGAPSIGSRGVVDPLVGDNDPGAYITGLGHRIDPDVELASVAHLHSFRARGRSVDARRPSGPATPTGARFAHEEGPGGVGSGRRASSDTEQSPAALLARSEVVDGKQMPVVPALDLSRAKAYRPNVAGATTQSSSSPDTTNGPSTAGTTSSLPTPPGSANKTRPRFTLHEDEDEDGENEHEPAAVKSRPAAQNAVEESAERGRGRGRSPPVAAAAASASAHMDARKDAPGSVDDDGFTRVGRAGHHHYSPRCSRPAAETLVPQDFSAFANTSSTSEEDSDMDHSRTDSEPEERHSRRQQQQHVASATAPDVSSDEGEDGRRSSRGRGGRGGRGRSVHRSRPVSPDDAASSARSRQCAIGLFSSSKTSRRDSQTDLNKQQQAAVDAAADANSAGGVRTVRSSPNLSYARVAASRPLGAPRRESRNKVPQVGAASTGGDRTIGTATTAMAGPQQQRRSGDRDRDRDSGEGGRGRGGSVKVTSSSFSASEHPPNSLLPRSSSMSNLESLTRRQNMTAAALGTGSSVPGPPPALVASPSPAFACINAPSLRAGSSAGDAFSLGGGGSRDMRSRVGGSGLLTSGNHGGHVGGVARQHRTLVGGNSGCVVPSSPSASSSSLTQATSSSVSPASSPTSPPPPAPTGTGSATASQAAAPIIMQPRPTLLSNSAHLLMLSLELEMMRAQKISGPLKVRWVRQRAAVPLPAATTNQSADATAAAAATTNVCPPAAISPSPLGDECAAPAGVEGDDALQQQQQHLPSEVGEHGGDIVAPCALGVHNITAETADERQDGGGQDPQSDDHNHTDTMVAEDQQEEVLFLPMPSHIYTYKPKRASNLRHVVNATAIES